MEEQHHKLFDLLEKPEITLDEYIPLIQTYEDTINDMGKL